MPFQMLKYCLENLADYQIPSSFYVVSDFPRGSLNKISKYEIKKNIKNYVKKQNIILDNYTSL